MGSRHPFPEKKNNYQRSLEFFENLLRQNSPCRLSDEYPLVFHSEAQDQIHLIEEKNVLKAGLATLEREIEVQPDRFARALFVGSVVTHPDFRNQGYQKTLFEQLEWRAKQQEIDFLILWSNQVEFYERLGFSLAGLQASWMLTSQVSLRSSGISVQLQDSSRNVWSDSFFEQFDRKRFRVKRTKEEMQKLFCIPQMLIASTSNAYAIVGKGEDFHGVCHEWAGPAKEVVACFAKLQENLKSVRILSPGVLHDSTEVEVTTALEEAGIENRLEYLGLMKALNPRYKMEDLQPENLRYPFFIWGLDSI